VPCDLFAPRSAWTNKLITAKDHASVQINIGHLDGEGVYSGTFTTYAFSGAVRQRVRGRGGAPTKRRRQPRVESHVLIGCSCC
jgi:small subunit ribosomal protein S21e